MDQVYNDKTSKQNIKGYEVEIAALGKIIYQNATRVHDQVNYAPIQNDCRFRSRVLYTYIR